MTGFPPRFVPLGDSAVTIVIGEGISRELSREVLRLAEALRSASIAALAEVVPAYASLTLFYDPLAVTYDELLEKVRPVVERSRAGRGSANSEPGRTIHIPVRYDGEDLAEVAERTGHTTDEVVSLHSSREYHVYIVGFVPGFAYLGELHPSLVLPRRSVPRKRVPAGSVAVAEAQTGIYPFPTPGGWHLIGRTDVQMFDAASKEPALLRVGDRVIFDPVSA
jgi:KipI family sensor histidine kinase inhibitor